MQNKTVDGLNFTPFSQFDSVAKENFKRKMVSRIMSSLA